jgi:3-oxoacyl-[acyl-carrier protein] reductase
LGAAVARGVAAKGARVVINYTKSLAEAEETVQACADLGSEAALCQGDVSVDADCRRMAAAALEKWGRIDGLVNNAGASKFASHADLESLTGDDFLHIYNVNVVGAYQMTRAAAPHMKAQGRGTIVNVSSISAITGSGSSIAYAASKGALNTMTVSLARALAPEVRVNAVCPGPINTDRMSYWERDQAAQRGLTQEQFRAQIVSASGDRTPLGRIAEAEDVANLVSFLAGPDSEFITGQSYNVNGGLLFH